MAWLLLVLGGLSGPLLSLVLVCLRILATNYYYAIAPVHTTSSGSGARIHL